MLATNFRPFMICFTGDNWTEIGIAVPPDDRQAPARGSAFLLRLRGDGLVPMWIPVEKGDWIFSFEPGELDLAPNKMGAWLSQLYAVAIADYFEAEAANG